MTNWREILSYRDPAEEEEGDEYHIYWDITKGGISTVTATSFEEAYRLAMENPDIDESYEIGSTKIYMIENSDTGENLDY